MEAMMKRDQAIAAVGEQIADMKQQVRERSRQLEEEKEFLSTEEANNKQLVVSIGTAERSGEKKRELLMSQKREIVEFQDEVATQRGELEEAEHQFQRMVTMNASLKGMREDKQRRLEEMKRELESTKHKLETEFATGDDLAQRASQVDSLHTQHETRLKQVDKDLSTLKEDMFKHSHTLFTLRKKEADLIAEISGAQGTSRNLQSRVHELDQRSLKQQEMLYTIEFQVQQLERKVSRAGGKRSLEETVKLNAEIVLLQKLLEASIAEHAMIISQVKRLHDDVRAAKRKYDDVVVERKKLEEKIVEADMELESSTREVKESVKSKEENIVSHDVLKLEVKRLRDLLATKADDVLALENRKLQLELSMKEREKEVGLHQDVQKMEAKAAEEGRHNLAMDLKERQIKVNVLKSKYETIAARMAGPEDGEQHSQAFYIIQAAQNREELQREGDELNRGIRKSEKEIRMLTKTLTHLTTHNQAYRDSFHKADMGGSDAKLKGDLEEQHRSVSDNLYKQKSYLREITTDSEERTRILQQLTGNINAISSEVVQKEAELVEVQHTVSQQAEQINRTNQEMLGKREEFRMVAGLQEGDEAPEDIYIALQERKRKNRVLLNLLRNFADENPDMLESISDTLEGAGLRLQRPSSAISSRRGNSAAGNHGNSASGNRPGTSGSSRGRPGSSGGFELPSVRGSRPASGRSRPDSRSGRPDSRGGRDYDRVY
jgi:chromosome segregation ATPase